MPTAPRPLTLVLCDAFRPTAGRQDFLWDGGDGAVKGFGLRVSPNGARAWVFQFKDAAGRDRRVTLGPVAAHPLAAARTWARAQRAQADTARADTTALDPAQRRAATRRRARAASDAPTCAELFDAFLADRVRRGTKPKTLGEYRRVLGEGARRGLPAGTTGPGALRAAFGARRVADVTRRDVQAFHDEHEAATPTQAWHYVTLLAAAFTFAEAEDWIPAGANPCRRVRKATRTPKRQALRDTEYHALGRALDLAARVGLPAAPARQSRARGMSAARRAKRTGKTRGPYARRAERGTVPQNPVAVALLRFLALSGWRSGEAKTLRWDAVDTTRRAAVLSDSKSGRSVRPVGASALAVLTEVRRRADYPPATPYVFPRLDDPAHPITEVDHVWAAVRHAAGLDAAARPGGAATVHGLRHAFTTEARALGYGDHIIALLVGHVLTGSQTSRYGDVHASEVHTAADRVARAVADMLDPAPTRVLAFARPDRAAP